MLKQPGAGIENRVWSFERKLLMADPAVQAVREWLQKQPFALRFLTLLLFMVEAIEEQFGKEKSTAFQNDMRETLRKLSISFDTVQ